MMTPQLHLLPGAISSILADVTDTQTLTLEDRYGLMAATLTDNLSEEETQAINRLLRSVVRGKVKYQT